MTSIDYARGMGSLFVLLAVVFSFAGGLALGCAWFPHNSIGIVLSGVMLSVVAGYFMNSVAERAVKEEEEKMKRERKQ